MRRLVVGLVQHDEIRLGRRPLEERHGADDIPVEVPVGLHHLLEQMVARRDPVDLEPAPQPFLQGVDHLQRHVGLAGADGRLQHHGRAAAPGEPGEARGDRFLLVLADLPVHPCGFSPKSMSCR